MSLYFSNKKVTCPRLLLNNIPILEVKSHKHLGCHLDSNSKWNTHIAEILAKAGRRVDILRGLKYKLDRRSLEILYTSFIRPILEYAQSVWSNCNNTHKSSIESIQLSAMRVITGAIRGTSHRKLYAETGFVSTADRRDRHNLIIFYKIYHGHTPNYLKELLTARRHQLHDYGLRNNNQLTTLNTRTVNFYNTFLPQMTRIWNALDNGIKYIGSLQDFINHMRRNDIKIPKYYYSGPRKWQLIHTRMRLGCSPLRHDLYSMKILPSEDCECGHNCEDVFHYFFVCPQYTHCRHILGNIHPSVEHSVENFLFGKNSVSLAINKSLFNTITSFIKLSNRF